MPLKIVRNDITKMKTDAIVNTANPGVAVGAGCDRAVYEAAGYDQLLAYRKEHIGEREEGEVFITPGFDLPARYIIHAVSPYYIDGTQKEEEKLRARYRKSLKLALEHGVSSIAFPVISTGGYGYPLQEGIRIAVDEINAFLLDHDMLIYLVVFDEEMTRLGKKIVPDLEAYIDANYVDEQTGAEYGSLFLHEERFHPQKGYQKEDSREENSRKEDSRKENGRAVFLEEEAEKESTCSESKLDEDDRILQMEAGLAEHLKGKTATFSEYLMDLIRKKGLKNADVYQNGAVDKKVFSKIKNNPEYHPGKLTVLCLCIGAHLSVTEAEDLLAKAGYAFSPCSKTDLIFRYFIENRYYDIYELDIQLEEHGEKCIIA